MEIEIEIEEARRRWADLERRVARGARVILLDHGRPVAALVGRDDYLSLERAKLESMRPTGPPN